MEQLSIEILSRLLSVIFIIGMLYVFYLIISRNAKKSAENSKDAYVCPKCGSVRLSIEDKMPSPAKFITSVPPLTFHCHDCDYEGIAPKMDKIHIATFKRKLKEQKGK